jgi:PilZ domain
MTNHSGERTNPPGVDRRRHPRHRFIHPLTIKKPSGEAHRATSFEISESGLSLATTVPLQVGEEVELELTLVAKATVRAVVKHSQRTCTACSSSIWRPISAIDSSSYVNGCHYFRPWRTFESAFFPEARASIAMWNGSINFSTSTSSPATSRSPRLFFSSITWWWRQRFSKLRNDLARNCSSVPAGGSRVRSCSARISSRCVPPFSPTSPS